MFDIKKCCVALIIHIACLQFEMKHTHFHKYMRCIKCIIFLDFFYRSQSKKLVRNTLFFTYPSQKISSRSVSSSILKHRSEHCAYLYTYLNRIIELNSSRSLFPNKIIEFPRFKIYTFFISLNHHYGSFTQGRRLMVKMWPN